MRITFWLRVAGPFLAGCFAGFCIALGVVFAVRAGLVFQGDPGYFLALALAAACLLIGGWLVIFNGMEWYRK